MKKFGLSILAYVLASFVVQSASHFALNAEHYASIPFMRAEPIMAIGVLVMLAQGIVMARMYPRFHDSERPIRSGWLFAMSILVILGGYIALVEPSKYAVPYLGTWALVEGSAAFVQFSLYGILLGSIHQRVQ